MEGSRANCTQRRGTCAIGHHRYGSQPAASEGPREELFASAPPRTANLSPLLVYLQVMSERAPREVSGDPQSSPESKVIVEVDESEEDTDGKKTTATTKLSEFAKLNCSTNIIGV